MTIIRRVRAIQRHTTGKVIMGDWKEAAQALVAALGERAAASLVMRLSRDMFDIRDAARTGGPSRVSWVTGHQFLKTGACIREALDERWYKYPAPGSSIRLRIEDGDAANWLAIGLRAASHAVAATHGDATTAGAVDARALLYWSVLDVACALLRRREPVEVAFLADELVDACGLELVDIADASRAYLYPVDVAWKAGTLVASGGAA
jgi:hypothetical protein